MLATTFCVQQNLSSLYFYNLIGIIGPFLIKVSGLVWHNQLSHHTLNNKEWSLLWNRIG